MYHSAPLLLYTCNQTADESLMIIYMYVSFIIYFFLPNQDEPEKWLRRGYEAKDEENFAVATQCLTYSLLFCPMKNTTLLSTLYALRAETNYRMTRTLEARKDIAKCRKVDAAVVKVCVSSLDLSKCQMYHVKLLRFVDSKIQRSTGKIIVFFTNHFYQDS